jgi:8-oxo-dGTP diphosphatase
MPGVFVACDVVLFAKRDAQVLLIRRGRPPFKWALPGGFAEENETLEQTALRELREETGITGVRLEQLHAFGDPGRDPRGRAISVAYFGRVQADRLSPRAGDDAADVRWHPVRKLPPLAFDHRKIIAMARTR